MPAHVAVQRRGVVQVWVLALDVRVEVVTDDVLIVPGQRRGEVRIEVREDGVHPPAGE